MHEGSGAGWQALAFVLSVLCALGSVSCGGATPATTASAQELNIEALLDEGQRAEHGRGVPHDLTRARAAYQRVCEAGAQRGCALLGHALGRGPRRGRDMPRALALAAAACDAGEPLGCTELGWLQSLPTVVEGGAVEPDEGPGHEEVCALHRRACDAGEPTGCARVAGCVREGAGATDAEARDAAARVVQACEAGHAESCGELAGLCERGLGVERDLDRARKLYGTACDGGSPAGCTGLGLVYAEGRGVDPDYERAAELYREACERGDPRGCARLGSSYNLGLGVVRNERRAASLFRRACREGAGAGCSALGYFYEHGRAVPQDRERAEALYREACALRDGGGCNDLGVLYFNGNGVEQSLPRAMELYRLGCELGAIVPCTNLATIVGQGTNGHRDPEDIAESARLYGLACERGHTRACSWQASMLVRLAWSTEREADPSAARERALALYRQACALQHEGACLQQMVMEGHPVSDAREWDVEILEATNAPDWIRVGDVCHALVLTGADLVHLRVTCHGRFIYPPGSVIHWRGEDSVADDLTTRDNADARLLMDDVTGVFVLEDDETGFLPNIRLLGRLHPPGGA